MLPSAAGLCFSLFSSGPVAGTHFCNYLSFSFLRAPLSGCSSPSGVEGDSGDKAYPFRKHLAGFDGVLSAVTEGDLYLFKIQGALSAHYL